MNPDKNNHEEAIRRIISRSAPEQPSVGFTARIMDKLLIQPEPVKSWMITYQYGILALAAGIALLMLVFPAWTVFDFDLPTASTSAAQMAGNLLKNAAVWLSHLSSKIGPIGFYAYFIPVSVAILFVTVFDQVISHNKHIDPVS